MQKNPRSGTWFIRVDAVKNKQNTLTKLTDCLRYFNSNKTGVKMLCQITGGWMQTSFKSGIHFFHDFFEHFITQLQWLALILNLKNDNNCSNIFSSKSTISECDKSMDVLTFILFRMASEFSDGIMCGTLATCIMSRQNKAKSENYVTQKRWQTEYSV